MNASVSGGAVGVAKGAPAVGVLVRVVVGRRGGIVVIGRIGTGTPWGFVATAAPAADGSIDRLAV